MPSLLQDTLIDRWEVLVDHPLNKDLGYVTLHYYEETLARKRVEVFKKENREVYLVKVSRTVLD